MNIENSVRDILSTNRGMSPLVIRNFLKFLLCNGIYAPYIGRLVTSDWPKNYPLFKECDHQDIIRFSFSWEPDCLDIRYEPHAPSIVYFNNSLLDKRWFEISDLWGTYCRGEGL